jgi:restriction system protein
MDALVAIFTILFTFWPLLILFGLEAFSDAEKSFNEKLRFGLRRILLAWFVWAIFLAVIYLNGRVPFSLFPETFNNLMFLFTGIFLGTITLLWELSLFSKKRVRLEDAEKLEDLIAMDPDQFEVLVTKVFRAYGLRAERKGGNFDHGVDIVIYNLQGEKWIAQCKRYKGTVGEPVLRDLYGTMLHERASRAFLVTTGTFTRQAKAWVQGKPIICYDGEGLVRLIRHTQSNQKKIRRRPFSRR